MNNKIPRERFATIRSQQNRRARPGSRALERWPLQPTVLAVDGKHNSERAATSRASLIYRFIRRISDATGSGSVRTAAAAERVRHVHRILFSHVNPPIDCMRSTDQHGERVLCEPLGALAIRLGSLHTKPTWRATEKNRTAIELETVLRLERAVRQMARLPPDHSLKYY